jgi:5'-nucleotidase
VFVAMAVAVAGWLVSPIGDAAVSRPAATAQTPPRALRILVTNDDGVGAAGIDAVARALRALPNTQVDIIAPATNQSGSGDKTTSTPITVANTTTSSGLAARSETGFPADSVLFGILQGLPARPDLIVSGINLGQNIGAEIVNISGTAGAALWSARLHVPAIAVSQGPSFTDFTYAANLTANLVQLSRSSLLGRAPTAPTKVLNVNVPTCPTVRGTVNVPVGRVTQFTGYTPPGTTGTFTATLNQRSINAVNCSSTATNPVDDIDAFNANFAPLSTLNPDQNAG